MKMRLTTFVATGLALGLATACAPVQTAATPASGTTSAGNPATSNANQAAGATSQASTPSATATDNRVGSLATAQRLFAGGGGGPVAAGSGPIDSARAALAAATNGVPGTQYRIYRVEGTDPTGKSGGSAQFWRVYLRADDGTDRFATWNTTLGEAYSPVTYAPDAYKSGYEIDVSRWQVDSSAAVSTAMNHNLGGSDYVDLVSPAEYRDRTGASTSDPVWAVGYQNAVQYVDATTGAWLR